jgi:hypothetical protein
LATAVPLRKPAKTREIIASERENVQGLTEMVAEEFSRAKAQRNAKFGLCVFLCVFAPLREN